MTHGGIRCPHCGILHKEYVLFEGGRTPMCMECGKFVPKDLVSGCIQYRPSKPSKKKGTERLFKREAPSFTAPRRDDFIEDYREGRGRDEGVSMEDVREMVEDTLERRNEKREWDVLRRMDDRISRMESGMANITHQIKEGISKAIEKRKQAVKKESKHTANSDKITKAELNKMFSDLEKKYLEKAFEGDVEKRRERVKSPQEIMWDVSKERGDALKELAFGKSADVSNYQEDTARLIGEGLSGLKDVVEKREPVKNIVEGIRKLLYPKGRSRGKSQKN